jgi:predicted SprT family Zn-dependent metalloprotease
LKIKKQKKELKSFLKKLEKKSKKIFGIRKFNYKLDLTLVSTNILGLYKRSYIKGKQNHTLSLNISLFKLNTKDIKTILLHEFAHYITYRIYRDKINSHGREWRMVMKALGAKEISSKTNIASKIKRKDSDVKVKCKCSTHYISKNRYTRMKNGTKYRCKKCNKKLK